MWALLDKNLTLGYFVLQKKAKIQRTICYCTLLTASGQRLAANDLCPHSTFFERQHLSFNCFQWGESLCFCMRPPWETALHLASFFSSALIFFPDKRRWCHGKLGEKLVFDRVSQTETITTKTKSLFVWTDQSGGPLYFSRWAQIFLYGCQTERLQLIHTKCES